MPIPSTHAWLVTYLDSPEAVKVWNSCRMHNARVSSKLDVLITKLQGRFNALDIIIEKHKSLASQCRSEYLRGLSDGQAISTEVDKEWLMQDLEQLREIQKDLLAVLGR